MRSKRRIYMIGIVAASAFCTGLLLAENIDPDNDGSQYAYGQNVGWLNFEPNHGPGVTVAKDTLSGYVWGENIGWINLHPDDTNPESGVRNNGTGRLSGYAWGENVGWINFNPKVAGDPTHYGVTIDPRGQFNGWAWGENIGWINFRSADLYDKNAKACIVTFHDLANFADNWLAAGPALPADLTANNNVDFEDYSKFSNNWHNYCPEGWKLK